MKDTILVTGANGFIGNQLLKTLHQQLPNTQVIGTDIKPTKAFESWSNYTFYACDVRDTETLEKIFATHKIKTVVHLASVVTPPPNMSREELYDIDVEGTRNILEAAVLNEVDQIVITSSGAAYGYHPENNNWLKEDAPIRGNESFAYSFHKREVEELLAIYRKHHPQLRQLILRPGTVLGEAVNNQITDLFKKPVMMGIMGYPSPFVFIWDKDLVNIIIHGITNNSEGIYNVAGDGALTPKDIANLLGKRYLPIPVWLIKLALSVLKPLGLSQYGPEQVKFLMYRPVLLNQKLKDIFGFTPTYSSKEAFLAWLSVQQDLTTSTTVND